MRWLVYRKKRIEQIFLKLLILYWKMANQQCCDSFRWTERDSVIHIHVSILPQTPAINISLINLGTAL